jgi:hypothetical protein
MDLRELNARVTSAIFRAEHLPPGSLEADLAFDEVSQVEAEIARRTTPDTVEGAIARRGAVTAARRAHDVLRALSLAETYLAEPAPAELGAELRVLRDQAEAELSTRVANVRQVFFELHAA